MHAAQVRRSRRLSAIAELTLLPLLCCKMHAAQVRNEQEIDSSMEEMEELEEQLCDSIR